MSGISIYPVGTYVKFLNGKDNNEVDEELPVGMIVEVILKSESVEYGISWWTDGVRCYDVFDEVEFAPTVSKENSNEITKKFVGFN